MKQQVSEAPQSGAVESQPSHANCISSQSNECESGDAPPQEKQRRVKEFMEQQKKRFQQQMDQTQSYHAVGIQA